MGKLSRKTRQKRLLQNEAEKFTTFFRAEELFHSARKKDKGIGMATVYRFLNDSRRKNLIHAYSCENRMLFSVSNKTHCHFKCQECGLVSSIRLDSVDFIQRKIRGSVCHFQLEIEGICEDCIGTSQQRRAQD
ncbi:transcriptional repressor [Candidatus Woesearchaeota archaeon]|nr:transcriptional repressor [Candidatus Woesearchaeota archaeon]